MSQRRIVLHCSPVDCKPIRLRALTSLPRLRPAIASRFLPHLMLSNCVSRPQKCVICHSDAGETLGKISTFDKTLSLLHFTIKSPRNKDVGKRTSSLHDS